MPPCRLLNRLPPGYLHRTFSKTLFPALRIGFALLPDELQDGWLRLRQYSDIQNPVAEQLTLSEFLQSRKMDKHVRRMKKSYARKRKMMITAINQVLPPSNIIGDQAGLHFGLQIPGKVFDSEFKKKCLSNDMHVTPCKNYALNKQDYTDVLLLGYGNVREENIMSGIKLLGELMN